LLILRGDAGGDSASLRWLHADCAENGCHDALRRRRRKAGFGSCLHRTQDNSDGQFASQPRRYITKPRVCCGASDVLAKPLPREPCHARHRGCAARDKSAPRRLAKRLAYEGGATGGDPLNRVGEGQTSGLQELIELAGQIVGDGCLKLRETVEVDIKGPFGDARRPDDIIDRHRFNRSICEEPARRLDQLASCARAPVATDLRSAREVDSRHCVFLRFRSIRY
jgi:hypothetical protein